MRFFRCCLSQHYHARSCHRVGKRKKIKKQNKKQSHLLPTIEQKLGRDVDNGGELMWIVQRTTS